MTEPVEPGRKPFIRVVAAPLVAGLLAVALFFGAGLHTSVMDAIAKSVSGSCAGLDTSQLDPLNPAQRPCYCDVNGKHEVCRMDMITGSIPR